ncbi:MAG: TonB-dependent receptor [Saprospiraceae bacterium]
MKFYSTTLLLFFSLFSFAQSAAIKGQLQDEAGAAVGFVNVALYNAADSSMVKVEITEDNGIFNLRGLNAGNYYLIASFVGYSDFKQNDITLTADQQLDLGVLSFATNAVELETATVTASRAMVEVKPDRTVFNVQGTINSSGADGIELLRKAPGVMVDNNENLTVLGRSGVLVYVDGKRLPLTGQDLSTYLKNLPAEQIDRIDIITNPGAKYEAEGNAGIIDIRLKRDESHGANGSVNATGSQGRHWQSNAGFNGNYRNKNMNVFGQLGYYNSDFFNEMDFESVQNGLFLIEDNNGFYASEGMNARIGTDFFLGKNHTIGFLASLRDNDGRSDDMNSVSIAQNSNRAQVDSVLIANNRSVRDDDQQTFNVNYRFDNGKSRTVNVDLDYGRYNNQAERFQPNRYFEADLTTPLSSIINNFETPTRIDIYTAKVDFEDNLLGGKVGFGGKFSMVSSDNTFLVFDEINNAFAQNNRRSNQFDYDESVYAGYVSYNRKLNDKWNFSAGLRAEQTDATGNLQVFDADQEEPPVELNYLNLFPSAGLTWQAARMHSFALNYGRRINRPDYNVLNPFRNQLSEISFEKGNPFLNPEIVNNIELGYTYAYRFNFKLAYSRTTDQITRLIAPDDADPRANFITWANLATQDIVSFNASLPLQLTEWWSMFVNASANYTNNQADYGEGAIVDVQVFSYNFYQQQTFNLPKGFKGEISGWFAGPGVWGGVFRYESQWSLNLGLQRKFFNDQLNVRLAANDIFYQSGWDGVSEFDGLISAGGGRWDSRRVSMSLTYNFGNQKVKSRKRKTGLEDEAGRIQSGN